MTSSAVTAALVDEASAPYRAADLFAYYQARGKLGNDPAFVSILEQGLLTQAERVLDLGCGSGLLTSWLLATRSRRARNTWPANWPASPCPISIRGIELRERNVRRARLALGDKAEFVMGDIRDADYETADAIIILDVLHYIDYGAQERVLERVRMALPSGGMLLLRVGDANGGLPFTIGRYVDRAVLVAQGHGFSRMYCRSINEWQAILVAAGFRTRTVPMSTGKSFANVLLVARPR